LPTSRQFRSLSEPARSSSGNSLLLRGKHLGSLLIHLLHSLRPLLQSLGLDRLGCRPLLLLLHCGLSLGRREGLLLGYPLLPDGLVLRRLGCQPLLLLLHCGLSLAGLDCSLLLLQLLPSLGSGLCFVLVPAQLAFLHRVAIPAVAPMPVAIAIFATGPIAASTDEYVGSVVARAKVTRRIAISWVDWRAILWAAVRIGPRQASRLLGAAEKQNRQAQKHSRPDAHHRLNPIAAFFCERFTVDMWIDPVGNREAAVSSPPAPRGDRDRRSVAGRRFGGVSDMTRRSTTGEPMPAHAVLAGWSVSARRATSSCRSEARIRRSVSAMVTRSRRCARTPPIASPAGAPR
jgi:hypothetical protein